MNRNYLVISDLQIPFEHPNALKFCAYLKRHFNIADDCVLNVGDELDQYWGSLYDKSIDVEHTANQEFDESIERLKDWYSVFPKMLIAESNHGVRWKRKAFESQILTRLVRKYQDVIGAPEGWRWDTKWEINTRKPFIMVHGDNYGGQYPHIEAVKVSGKSCVMGHFHSIAGVRHIQTDGYNAWGFCTGSLIDFDRYAFNYAKRSKFKPLIGAGVIFDDGRTPVWFPMV